MSPLPPDLPEDERPTALGCDYEAPERTIEECRGWAATVVEYQNEAWDKVGREMLVRLCHAGSGRDCALAAELVKKGMGGPREPDVEQQYRNEACRLGETAECHADVARSVKEHQALLERLRRECGEGIGKSCYEYGIRLWDIERDAAGLEFFEKGCQLGVPNSCRRAGAARDALRGRGPW